MKSNELRIGNHTKQGEIISFFESGIHVGYGATYSFNNVEPIPLTEEWLINLGFEKSKGNFSIDFSLGYLELEYHVIMDLWEFNIVNVGDAWDDPVIVSLKSPQYVHQLQNLYFALTGEELTLTNNK